MKLTIKEVLPYLPYGLQFVCICPDSMEYEVSDVSNIHFGNEIIEVGATEFEFSDLGGQELKPVFRSLSDLKINDLDLSCEEKYCLERIQEGDTHHYGNLSYLTITYLYKNHFDFMNLIKKGLAADKNILE